MWEYIYYICILGVLALIVIVAYMSEKDKYRLEKTSYQDFDFKNYPAYVGKYCYISTKTGLNEASEIYRCLIDAYNPETQMFVLKTSAKINKDKDMSGEVYINGELMPNTIFYNIAPKDIFLEYFE